MARGLYENWKQPIAFFFVGSTYPASKLKDMLETCILQLEDAGFLDDCVVTDMGSNFIQLTNLLNVSPENPQFLVGHRNIVYLFDTPHLMKATRNNLQKNYWEIDKNKTSCTYIEQFYNSDKLQTNRKCPKLTHSHIRPNNFEKMKVNLAVQVLSHSVASGMETDIALGLLPTAATYTVEVIRNFNNLFDMLNCSLNRYSTIFQRVFDGDAAQITFLEKMCNYIKNIVIYNENGNNITKSMKFLR